MVSKVVVVYRVIGYVGFMMFISVFMSRNILVEVVAKSVFVSEFNWLCSGLGVSSVYVVVNGIRRFW